MNKYKSRLGYKSKLLKTRLVSSYYKESVLINYGKRPPRRVRLYDVFLKQ